MRTLPQGLKDALATGATTLCRCWRVTRRDGVVMGFTDHDRPVSFDGLSYEPESGFSGEAIESATGLGVDSHTVQGALSSSAITDEDVERGLYDGAEVELWLVDWQEASNRLLLTRGTIGEIRRKGIAFEAEIVGLAEKLNQPYGRAYLATCDRRLGDEKCGVDLSSPLYSASGTVTALLDPQRFAVSGLDAFSRGWFDNGRLVWSSGANAGGEAHVKMHLAPSTGASLELWLSPPLPVAVGDSFTVTAGCDKTFATCKQKFNNIMNFRGFPHMPGDDWVAAYVKEAGQHDGGSLVGG